MALSPWRSLGRWLLFSVLVASVAVVGCGKKTGDVTGKVTVMKDGAAVPVKGGTVTFIGADGVTKGSLIAEDGSYTVKDLPVGTAKIAVDNSSLLKQMTVPTYATPDSKGYGGKLPDPEEAKRRYVPIDAKYATVESSSLTYVVKPGKQEHPIELK